jgi:two-component system, NarL family, sensor histidine kinase DevS
MLLVAYGRSAMMDEQARGLLDAAGSVLGELDLEIVIDRLLASARELTGARYAALGVLDCTRTELERFITVGIDEHARAEIGALPRGRGVLGELILDPVPLRLAEVGQHPHSYGFPVGHPPMHSFLGVPIVIGGVPFGSLYLTEKAGGGQFTDADEESVTTLARFACVAIDHARRYTGAAARGEELARSVAALEATTEIARAVGGETDLELILELVAKRGRALVGARTVLIELVSGNQLVVAAVAGDRPAGLIGERIVLADTVASAALRTRATQRLEAELNRARFDQHEVGKHGVSAHTGMVVPLIFHDEAHGVLVVLDRLHDGPAFTAEDQRLLEAFATSAATAVATARTVASELNRQRLAAAEGERGRWARELHDETLQSLAALRIALSTAHRTGGVQVLDNAVVQAIEDLDDGMSNLRSLVTDLRPVALDDLGLAAAIEALCERASHHGLEVDRSIELVYEQGREPTRHTSEVETAAYRIIQEALTNATRHSQAKRAVIELFETEAMVELTVRDDGHGFDPAASTTGFGLLGMRERVELLAGAIQIESSPGNGTTLTASFPVQRRAGEIAAATHHPLRPTGTP